MKLKTETATIFLAGNDMPVATAKPDGGDDRYEVVLLGSGGGDYVHGEYHYIYGWDKVVERVELWDKKLRGEC